MASFKGSDQPTPLIEPSPSSTVPESDRDSEDEYDYLSKKPIGPVDPSKSTASGAGIGGGTACAPSTFIVTTKDSDGRQVPNGGALIRVEVSPGVGVHDTVKDVGDGSYSVTYIVPKIGNYMVSIQCNGVAVMGSPFPVFFSQAATTSRGNLSQVPMAPSAAAMAAGQVIVAPQTLKAHASQMEAQARSNKGSSVYGKTKEATAALALNNMEVSGRPQKPSPVQSSPFALPMMMQQAIAMQQAAKRAAAMKSATELAAARDAEISRKLNPDQEPSYRRRRRSPSYSPPRFDRPRSHRSRSPYRFHRRPTYEGRRRSYRDSRESWRYGRSDEHHSSSSRRRRSVSPKKRKSKQDDSELSRHRRHGDKEAKSTRRDDEETKHKHRTRSRSKSVEDSADKKDEGTDQEELKHHRNRSRSRSREDLRKTRDASRSSDDTKRKHGGKSRSKSLEINNGSHEDAAEYDDYNVKEERRGRSRSRSLETKHRSSRKSELVEGRSTGSRRRRSRSNKPGHHTKEIQSRDKRSKRRSGRRSRSVSSEVSHRRERRSSPDEKKSSRHKGHSRSREKRNSSRDKRSKHHERLRSASPWWRQRTRP